MFFYIIVFNKYSRSQYVKIGFIFLLIIFIDDLIYKQNGLVQASERIQANHT